MRTKKKREPIYVGCINLSHNAAVTYTKEITGFFNHKRASRPASNLTSGQLSKKASSKIKHVYTWLVASSYYKEVYSRKDGKRFWFKLNFITLTLSSPQIHSDQYIKDKMLSSFIQWLQRKNGVRSYIWKAEAQGNGNIHFHITTDKFIHHNAIRLKWNSIQQEHGYLKHDSDFDKIKLTNSTDVKAVKKPKKLILYMIKYFTMEKKRKNYVSRYCTVSNVETYKKSCEWFRDSEGYVWEHYRKINGMLWNHSNNLPTRPLNISGEDIGFNGVSDWLQLYQNSGSYWFQRYNIIPLKPYSWKELPMVLKKQYITTVEKIRAKDIKKTLYEVEEF